MLYSQTYYYPSSAPPDGVDPSLFILLLIFIGFIAALVWLVNYDPPKKEEKPEKPLREEIEGIFKDLRDNALAYNRPEFVPTLDKAREKVTDALVKRNLT